MQSPFKLNAITQHGLRSIHKQKSQLIRPALSCFIAYSYIVLVARLIVTVEFRLLLSLMLIFKVDFYPDEAFTRLVEIA